MQNRKWKNEKRRKTVPNFTILQFFKESIKKKNKTQVRYEEGAASSLENSDTKGQQEETKPKKKERNKIGCEEQQQQQETAANRYPPVIIPGYNIHSPAGAM